MGEEKTHPYLVVLVDGKPPHTFSISGAILNIP
jgi:hypothetical protein